MKERLTDSLAVLAVALLLIGLCILAVPLAVVQAWADEWRAD